MNRVLPHCLTGIRLRGVVVMTRPLLRSVEPRIPNLQAAGRQTSAPRYGRSLNRSSAFSLRMSGRTSGLMSIFSKSASHRSGVNSG